MLPFHRRDARRESAAATEKAHPTSTMRNRLVPFFIHWIKLTWRDILTLIVLGVASLGIYQAPYAATRNFPITFDQSGDIVYPQFAYPDRGWIISPSSEAIICVVIPIGIMALAQLRIRSFWDLNNAVFGVLYSLILSSLFQVVIKQLVGGLRPIFLDVCRPDPSLAKSHNATGLNGVGFHQIMYTTEVCTNPDKGAIKNAMTSFPSGHSTTAFSAFVFLFLWMNAKLKVWANFHASFYWLAALLAPLLGATLMAACLTVDQAHNWYDICAGALIGTAVAFMVYRMCYAAVWDWRYNHVPLRHHRVFDYAAAAALAAPGVMEEGLFVRKLGWGRRRKGRGRRRGVLGMGKGKAGAGGASSAATYGGNEGASVKVPPEREVRHEHVMPDGHGVRGESVSHGEPVSYADPATVRPNGASQYHGTGEEMV